MDTRPPSRADLDARDGTLDVGHRFHVFEHLPNPMARVRHLARWLAPDGRLLPSGAGMRPDARSSSERFFFARADGVVPKTSAGVAGLVPEDHGNGTTAVFHHDADAAPRVAIEEGAQAERLACGYGRAFIAACAFGGRWLGDTPRRDGRRLRGSVATRA